MKVAIVGAGIMGLTIAVELVRRGHSVTILEQGDIPAANASSNDEHRWYRYSYGRDVGYSRLAVAAWDDWQMLWRTLGVRHYVETGALYFGSPDDPDLSASRDFAAATGLPVEELDGASLRKRFAQFHRDAEYGVLFGRCGVLLAREILASLVAWLQEEGATFRPFSQVRAVASGSLATDNGSVPADFTVIAAGPWVARLRPELARDIRTVRQICGYYHVPDDRKLLWARSPLFGDTRYPGCNYVIPPVCGTHLKVTFDAFEEDGDPDADRTLNEAERAVLHQRLAQALHETRDLTWAFGRACFYTMRPDRRFILDRDDRTFILSACSGHGFKFAPLLARVIADLVEEGSSLETASRLVAGQLAA